MKDIRNILITNNGAWHIGDLNKPSATIIIEHGISVLKWKPIIVELLDELEIDLDFYYETHCITMTNKNIFLLIGDDKYILYGSQFEYITDKLIQIDSKSIIYR